jgi:hypothetical protein
MGRKAWLITEAAQLLAKLAVSASLHQVTWAPIRRRI